MKATLYDTAKDIVAELDLPKTGVKPHVLVYKDRAYVFQDQGIKQGFIYREVASLIVEDAPEGVIDA